MRVRRDQRAFHRHRALRSVVLDGIEQEVDQHLLHAGAVGVDEAGNVEAAEGHADAALARLRLDHRPAFDHHLGQRHRLVGQRELARLDEGQVQHFVDQLQQVPAGLEDLLDVALLRRRRRRRARLQQLREPQDGVERRAQLVAHAGEEIRFGVIGLLGGGHGLFQLGLDALAHRIVGADQQVADEGAVVVAQRGDGHDRREAAAVLAHVGQLVDVLDLARGLVRQRLEARRDDGAELLGQCLGPGPHFLRVVDVAGADLVDDFHRLVAQHALGAHVEQLDDALLVGRDDREIGAGQDGVLQGAGLEQAMRVGAAARRPRDLVVGEDCLVSCVWHADSRKDQPTVGPAIAARLCARKHSGGPCRRATRPVKRSLAAGEPTGRYGSPRGMSDSRRSNSTFTTR